LVHSLLHSGVSGFRSTTPAEVVVRRRWISTIAYMSDELPAHVGDRPRTFIVNTDTCDRGGSHWVVFQFPLVGPAEYFDLAGKRTGNVSPPFRQCPDVQRTAILLLFVSNPTRRHRHLRTVLPVLLQTETSRNGPAGHSEILFHRLFKRKRGYNFKI
jgi:hypothetical protein